MPNVKFFVDEARYPAVQADLSALLPELRDMLCTGFGVDRAACQLAVIPVLGLPDQPAINAELHLLPKPDRTRATIESMAGRLRDRVAGVTGLHVAVRIATLDAATYVALK
ncbi:hypothetical protein [Neotabrizicola sp. VNH66]|uniref:hypothetical protein n=1 Tax=Neotabrizicola sp. VNH66 TaxID=3400918 RepID=UPI003C0062DD